MEKCGKLLPKHPRFGQPEPLSSTKIPTYCDVVCAIFHEQSQIRQQLNLKQNPPASKVVDMLADQIEKIAQGLDENKSVKMIKNIKIEVTKCIKIISHWSKCKRLSVRTPRGAH